MDRLQKSIPERNKLLRTKDFGSEISQVIFSRNFDSDHKFTDH